MYFLKKKNNNLKTHVLRSVNPIIKLYKISRVEDLKVFWKSYFKYPHFVVCESFEIVLIIHVLRSVLLRLEKIKNTSKDFWIYLFKKSKIWDLSDLKENYFMNQKSVGFLKNVLKYIYGGQGVLKNFFFQESKVENYNKSPKTRDLRGLLNLFFSKTS